MLIQGREKIGIENLKNPKAFVDYSQAIDDVHENWKDYNPTEKRRMLIVFDDIIADIESNKKLIPKVPELFLRWEHSVFHLFSSGNLLSKYPKLCKTKCNTLFYHENS